MKKKLFIAGCARSGTSALAQLLGSHEKIVMGMERYGHLYLKKNFQLSESLFTRERFLDVQENDTFYDDFDKFHAWDKNIHSKLEENNYVYIGDKRPKIYEVYDEFFSIFPDAKIIFIYRNVYEVAASWNKRAEEGKNWPATKDFKKAVHAWNNSLELTINALKKYPDNIVCIRYEDIFIEALDLAPLYKWLSIDIDKNTDEKLKDILKNSEKIQEKRKNYHLSDEQKEFCKEKASFRFENKLDSINLLR